MSEIIEFKQDGGRKAGRRALLRAQLIGQIIEALDKLGGSAHRDAVVEQIARERRLGGPAEVERLREQVFAVFVDHCEPDRGAGFFRKIYGPDSRRWGLSRTAEASLRQGGINLESIAV